MTRSRLAHPSGRGQPASAALLALFGLLCTLPAASGAQGMGQDVEALAAELSELRERLAELEALRERVDQLERELDEARADEAASAMAAPAEGPDKLDIAAMNGAAQAGTADAAVDKEPEEGVTLGGALRYNLYTTDYQEPVEDTRGVGAFDLFRLGADGRIGDFRVSAEYRFYSFMDVLHHGWIGYQFDEDSHVEFGVTRVPFGILPYAAHNFWFGTPYYVGLSDDYDLGVKYVRAEGPWEWQVAFFKNSEFGSSTTLERYSFDVVAVGDTANEETNQVNLRAAYTFGKDTPCSHEVGLSAQAGELYNYDTGRRGDHWAGAAHLDSRCGRWNLQLQAARYGYDPANPAGVSDEVIRMGGFATSFDVAAHASVLVANVAYNLPVPWEFMDQLTCYNDYSIVIKDNDRFRDSQLNTTGCLAGVGPLYIYFDLIRAENMVFFGEGSLAGGGQPGWDTRFNINVGYYW